MLRSALVSKVLPFLSYARARTAGVAAALIAVGVGGGASARADTVFSHTFDCPSFLSDDLNGQQGWSGDGTRSSNVGPLGGSYSMLFPATGTGAVAAARAVNIPVSGQIVTVTADFLRIGANSQGGISVSGDTGFIAQLVGGPGYNLGGFNNASPSTNFADGTWHRLVLTLDFTTNTLGGTVDGTSLGSIPISNPTAPTRITSIGLYSFRTAAALNVYFDNVSVVTSKPVNDLCAGALPIATGSTPFSNISAGSDGPAACGFIGSDIWYSYTAAASGAVSASTCGASYDTVLAAYTGVCGALAEVACNDDSFTCPGGCFSERGSRISFTATAGQTYLLRVGGFNADVGSGTLVLSLDTTGACCNPRNGQCTVLDSTNCTALGLNFLGLGAACSPAACTACPADFNLSGAVTVQDIFDFLASYFAGCP